MKERMLILVTIWVTAAQGLAAARSQVISEQVLDRTRNTKLVETVRQGVDKSGQPVVKTNRYVVGGSGLHRMDPTTGQWVESNPTLLVQSNGTVLGTGGAYDLKLSANLATAGAVELNFDQNRWKANLLCLAWFDPDTGKSKTLAVVTNSVAEVWPEAKKVVFRNGFDRVVADVIYEYGRGRFSQNILLREKLPAPPAEFGPHTRLEAISEVLTAPPLTKRVRTLKREKDPQRRAQAVEPDLTDEMLKMGEVMMPAGHAFWTDGTNSRPKTFAVGKRLMEVGQRTVLVEAVELKDVQTELDRLPVRTARADGAYPTIRVGHALPAPLLAGNSGTRRPTVQLAKVDTTESGFLLDYETSYNSEDFTFANGYTYLIDGVWDIVGATIQAGTVIKYVRYSALWVYVNINCYGGNFTASDDDSCGETISGSSGQPIGRYSNPALRLDILENDTTVGSLNIRHAVTGVVVDGGDHDHVVVNSYISNSDQGATAAYGSLTLDSVEFCNVDYWYSGNVSENSLTECDDDGLPNTWEMAYFGNLAQEPGGDYDGDGLTNLFEYEHDLNPANTDTDGDGMSDGFEWTYFAGFSRNGGGDYDRDGVSDLVEFKEGLNPASQDSNSDGVIDQRFKTAVLRPAANTVIP